MAVPKYICVENELWQQTILEFEIKSEGGFDHRLSQFSLSFSFTRMRAVCKVKCENSLKVPPEIPIVSFDQSQRWK